MSSRDGRRSLLAVPSSATVAGLSVGVIAPVITLALERRGVDAAVIGLLAATPPVTTFITGPIMPRVIARLGTLPSIYLGVFLAAAGIASLTLTAVMAGNILMQVPIGRLIDRLTAVRMLVICGLTGVGSCLVLPAVAELGPVLWLVLAVWGGFIGGIYTVGLTLLGQAVPLARLASGNTAFIMVFEIGSLSGPPLAGVAMDLWNPYGKLAIVAAPLVVVLAYLGLRRAPPA